MNKRETAEAYALGVIGLGIGVAKEIKSEITTERLEVAGLIVCTATVAILGKMMIDGWNNETT